jgi:hypothetical protein
MGRHTRTSHPRWKPGVVLLPREALLLRSRDDLAVDDDRGGRVVVERRDSQDRSPRRHELVLAKRPETAGRQTL